MLACSGTTVNYPFSRTRLHFARISLKRIIRSYTAKMWNALLIYNPGSSSEKAYPFKGQIVIGRRASGSDDQSVITIRDPMISSRHCVVTQSDNGRFFVRDVSRNGTRLAGRRLVPNVEFEIKPGDPLYCIP